MPSPLPQSPSLPGSCMAEELQEAGDIYWLNSLEGGHACLLLDSYGDLADGVALEEAFLLIEGYYSACSDNLDAPGRLRNALATVEERRGACAVPPRLLQPTFPLRVCRGEASACGELVAFLKTLYELNNGAGKNETIAEHVRHSRSSGSTSFNGPKRSRSTRNTSEESNGILGNGFDESTKGSLYKVGPTESRATAARRRARAGGPVLTTGRATTSDRRMERPRRNNPAFTPNEFDATRQGHPTSTDRSWPPPPPPPPPGGFPGPSVTASGLQKPRAGGYPGTRRLGMIKDDDRGPVAKTKRSSPAVLASAPDGAPRPPSAAVAAGTTKNPTSNMSSAARSGVRISVSPNLKRGAGVAVTATTAHPPATSVGTTREAATAARTREGTGGVGPLLRTTERGEVGTSPRRGEEAMPDALPRNAQTCAGTAEAGKRRAGRRGILRWMDRLGVKVDWSLLTAEGSRCHQRFYSGEVLCELAAAVDYAASGGRGLPLAEIPSCPGRFVLKGTCGAPANAARAKHNVRTALSAFGALGGIGGTWLRGETAILEGDHEATWGLIGDVYKRFGHLRSYRPLQPRRILPPPPPPPLPQLEHEQEQEPQQQRPRRRQQGQRQRQQGRTTAETPAPSPHRSPPPPSPGWPNKGSSLLPSDRKLKTKFAEPKMSAEGVRPSRLNANKPSADIPTKPIHVEQIGAVDPALAVKAADVEPPGTDRVGRMEPQPIPLPARIGRVAHTPTVTKAGTKTTGKRAERRISVPPPTRNASVAGLPSSIRRPGNSSSACGVRAKTSPLEQHSTVTASTVAAISISPRPGGTQAMKIRGTSVVAKEDAQPRLERQSVAPAGGAGAVDENVPAFPENKGGNRFICRAENEFSATGPCPLGSGRNAYGVDILLAGETRDPCRTNFLGMGAPALVDCAENDDGDDKATCDRVGGVTIKEPEHPQKEVLLPDPEQRVHHSDQRQDGVDEVLRNPHAGDKAVSETEKWLGWDPAARDCTTTGISWRSWGGSQKPHDKDAGYGPWGCATSWGRMPGTSGHTPSRQADIGGPDGAIAKSVDTRKIACNGRWQQPEGSSFASDATARPCLKGGTRRSAAFVNVVGAMPSDELATSPDCSRGNAMTGRLQRSAALGGLSSSAAAPVAYPGNCVGLEGGSPAFEHNNMVESRDADKTKKPKSSETKTLSFDDFHFSMTAPGSSFQLQGNVSEENPHEFQRLLQMGVEPRAVENSCAMGGIANNSSESVCIVQSSSTEDRTCERKAVHRSVCLLSPCRSTRSGCSVASGFFSDPFERSAASDLLPVAHREVK